jgi:AbiV family abortive infection protein
MANRNVDIINKEELKKACLLSAKAHLKNANSFVRKGNYALSTFFALSSIEESQKLTIIRNFEIGKLSSEEFNKCWIDHSHKFSLPNSIVRFILTDGRDEVEEVIVPGRTKTNKLKELRENCLYVDINNREVVTSGLVGISEATEYINEAKQELEIAKLLHLLAIKVKKSLQ